MKRLLFVGIATTLAALLMFSCNKNRYNLDNVQTVEANGEWKLPVGSARMTLGDLLEQFGDNEYISTFVSHDQANNIQIRFKTSPQRLLSGTMIQDMLNYSKVKKTFNIDVLGYFPGLVIEPVSRIDYSYVELPLSVDSAGIESIAIKSGGLYMSLESNLGVIHEIIVSSSAIIEENGDTLVRHFSSLTGNTIDLSGTSFNLRNPETGELDRLRVNFAVDYELSGEVLPSYEVSLDVGFKNLRIQEIRGFINSFVLDLDFAGEFTLPIDKFGSDGQLELHGVKLQVKEKSTFENLKATLQVNNAELFGGGQTPFRLFDGPRSFSIIPSNSFVNVMDETLDLKLDMKYDSARVSSKMIFGSYDPNPATPIVIRETSFLDVMVDALIPVSFTASNVTYSDMFENTLGEKLPEALELDMLKKCELSILLDSELPFNFTADLFAYDSVAHQVVDTIAKDLRINGSFDGTPSETLFVVDLVKDLSPRRLDNLKKASHFLVKLGLDTDAHDAILNLDNSIGVTVKADVAYDKFNIDEIDDFGF